MIPLRDTYQRRGLVLLVPALILVNVAVFLKELSLGPLLDGVTIVWGLVPARFIHWVALGGRPLDIERFVPIATSMFLHGGWMHLLGNMLFLWVFGRSLEDRVGHGRFLLLYFGGGLAAAMWQIMVAPDSTAPMVGASGAIAAVLGAYAVLLPRSRIATLIPLFIVPWIMEIPAIVFLVAWFALQFLNGYLAIGAGVAGGVAWWAHIGGFVFGGLLGVTVRLVEASRDRDTPEEPPPPDPPPRRRPRVIDFS